MNNCRKILIVVSLFLILNNISGQNINLNWVFKLGTSSFSELAQDMVIDNNGNTFITGYFEGTIDFDPSSNTSNLSSSGSSDIFIAKYDSLGSLLWAKKIGGNGQERAISITQDLSDNILILGEFSTSTDFNPGIGTFNLTSYGTVDVFILKLDALGNFIWAKQIGGIDYDYGNKITVDLSNNIYITGTFIGTSDFDTSPSIALLNTSSSNSKGIYIAKYNSSGNYIWAFTINSIGTGKYPQDLKTDSNGDIIIVGSFLDNNLDFDSGTGVNNLSTNGLHDIFIAKYNSSGNFLWAKQIGNTDVDEAKSVTIDVNNNIYVTGMYRFSILGLTSNGAADIFIAKYNSAGNFVWSKNIGGTSSDLAFSIKIGNNNKIYLTGYFKNNVDFDPSSNVFSLTSSGNIDTFVAIFDLNGNFVDALSIGGSANTIGRVINVDNIGNIFVMGDFTETTDFDPNTNTYNLSSLGSNDIFLLKLSPTITSIEDIHNYKNNFIIYPNPTLGKINIRTYLKTEETHYNIYNVFGEVVIFGKLQDENTIIELGNLSDGIYFFAINGNIKQKMITIIKE